MNITIIVKKIQRQQIADSPINTYIYTYMHKKIHTHINT